MTFFIADPHFGHANIIRMCGRPYADIEEMNEALIEAWNGRITEGDTVYILGDLFFCCKKPEEILRCLSGKKHLILGNHDDSWMGKVDLSRYFIGVDTMLELTDGGRRLTLCHYPLLTWKDPKTSYMIHGHIHGSTNADFWPLLRLRDNVLNAGVDVNGFHPVPFEELLENNRRWKAGHDSGGPA
jgi:calcineurin-like phosphoesterase family protein